MTYWVHSNNNFYIPPTPSTRILSTDEFVTRTEYFYHAGSDRLLTIGNPYQAIMSEDKVAVPKVSALQWRVFRVKLPDPNKFAFTDPTFYNPETQRLVWGLRGVEVGRGGPLGIPVSGHPLFNRFEDVENKGNYLPTQGIDNRQNIASDTKQIQTIIVGCKPATGEHWGLALRCESDIPKKGDCPPLELVNTIIEDGDMMEYGFGHIDFKALQENKSDAPIDVNQEVAKYPDYLKMSKDTYGDPMFFFARQEQMYHRHFFDKAGKAGESIDSSKYLKGDGTQSQKDIGSAIYFGMPSGSLVSSGSQLFNKPYWLMQAQGPNNGICWTNDIFVTVGDTTRGTNVTISVRNDEEDGENDTFKASHFNQYVRHFEEFDLQFMLQVCIVDLTPEIITHLHQMNPDLLEDWGLGINPPPSLSVHDKYRFIDSKATKCPDKVVPEKRKDPYADKKFWVVDLTEKLSLDLANFTLGRKFLYQTANSKQLVTRKRPALGTRTPQNNGKRRRKNGSA